MSARFLAVPRPVALGNLLPGDAWKNASLAERTVHLARAYQRLGVRETTANWGPWVKLYLATAGLFSPAPWCAAFVYHVLLESGADPKRLWKLPASTWSLATWAKANSRLHSVGKRGDLFVWSSGRGHCGIVVKRDGLAYTTIEGNTDRKGGREGDGVYERERTVALLKAAAKGGIWGFVDTRGLEV